ncbi:MAG: circularly permuted type 2 ATP-grasp protein [Ilumatobacteraceae bacterium]
MLNDRLLDSGGHDADGLTALIADLPDLAERQIDADRLLGAEGAGHIVHDLPTRSDGRSVALESRPWRLDPIPLVIDGAEFVELADGAIARMQMLEAILADLYGDRTLLQDAIVDPVALWGSPKYRLAAFGTHPVKRWMTNYAVDVVRSADGAWHVVRDITDAPAGVGYSLLGRVVTGRVHRDVISRLPAGRALRSLDPFADRLRDGLADVASTVNPRIVVLSGGVDHPSFVEQSFLANRLGLNLAEGADLVVRQRRVWLRSLAGLEPVDVLFRRLEDDRIDPMEVNAQGHIGVPGLLLAARSGGVSLANAHGSGVLEDPALAPYWDAAGAWSTGQRSTYQGHQPLTTMPESERRAERWATYPSFDGSRHVQRAVTLRLHLVASDLGIDVLQGGSARVLNEGDDPTTPTAASAKDVWVVGGTVAPPVVRRRQPLPQVDLIASVPTRAAEALFWAGRAMERAELIARATEVVLDRTSGALDAEVAEAWVRPGLDMLGSIAGITSLVDSSTAPDRAGVTLALAIDALAKQLGSFLAEATSVREFFSVTGGRMLNRIAGSRTRLRELVPYDRVFVTQLDARSIDAQDLESVVIDLASLVGLWNESVVQGPAWRFGEIGRRLERAFGVIDGVRGAFGMFDGAIGPDLAWLTGPRPIGANSDDHRLDFQRQRVVEMVLGANESLVAYRRRHRSDVEFEPAATLLLADANNPRSAASAIGVVRSQAERLGWLAGVTAADELSELLASASYASVDETAAVLSAVWTGCDRLARDVVGSHLTSPVDPRMMGRR